MAKGFMFLSTVFLARILGLQGFAYFSIFFTIAVLSSQLFSGFDNAFVRFYSEERKPSIIKAYLLIKIISTVLLIAIGSFSYRWIAAYLKIDGHYLLVLFSFVGGAITTMLSMPMSILQSKENFVYYSLILVLPRFLFALSVIVFWYISRSREFKDYFIIYLSTSFLALILALLIFSPKDYFVEIQRKEVLTQIKTILSFGKWLALSTILYSLYQRIDILIMSHFVEKPVVGIYVVAVRLASLVLLIDSALSVVLNPQTGKTRSFGGLEKYLKKSISTLLVILVPLFVIILLRNYLVILFFGPVYREAGSLFVVLVGAYTLGMFYTPGLYLFYILNKPYLVFIQTVASATTLFCSAYLLIPQFFSFGAASSVLLGSVVGLTVTTGLILAMRARGELKGI